MENNSKKITHIIEATATGTLAMASLLANSQATAGYRVEVIYSKRNETPKNISSYFSSEVQLINIQMNTWRSKLSSILKIRNKLKQSRPDNIFLHSSFAGFIGRLACIGTLGESRFLYIPHCISFMRKDIGHIKNFAFKTLEALASIKKSEYIACSNSEKKEIEKNIPFRKCHLVENAVNLEGIFKKENIEPRPGVTVITVGQIRPQKNPGLFSEIAKAVKSYDTKINFLWVGDGDENSKELLKSAGVEVLGWLPKEVVWGQLSNSDIYLSTASWEGMPVSIIEALVSGLPVVASHCAGNVDVIEHKKNGWLFNTKSEASEHILNLAKELEVAKEVVRREIKVIEQRFSAKRYIEDIEKILHPL